MTNKSSNRKRHTNGNTKTSYQSLEKRCMLAGNITVVDDVNLYIRGDQADNQFEVIVTHDQLEIRGLEGTTINQQESYVVAGAQVTDSGVTYEGGLRVNLGKGNDDFSVTDAQFESRSVIFGSYGDDNIEVNESRFLGGTLIQTFDGDDSVSTSGSQFDGGFLAITLEGEDSVSTIGSTFNGDSVVATGNEIDSIHSEGNHYMGDVNLLLTQSGNDEVQLSNPDVGQSQLGVFLGDGNDIIHGEFMDGNIESSVRIGGQSGVDHGQMSMNEEAESKVTAVTMESTSDIAFDGGVEGAGNILAGIDSFYRDETANQRYAAPVVLDETQTINSIEWTGTYWRDATPVPDPSVIDRGDSFIVEIYEGADDGAPNSSSVVRFEVGGANRVDSGETATQRVSLNSTFEYPIYDYSADIEYTMEAGKTYWVSIFTELDNTEFSEQNFWGWGYAFDQVSEAVMTQGFDNSDGTVDKNWRYISDDGPRPDLQGGLDLDFRLRS